MIHYCRHLEPWLLHCAEAVKITLVCIYLMHGENGTHPFCIEPFALTGMEAVLYGFMNNSKWFWILILICFFLLVFANFKGTVWRDARCWPYLSHGPYMFSGGHNLGGLPLKNFFFFNRCLFPLRFICCTGHMCLTESARWHGFIIMNLRYVYFWYLHIVLDHPSSQGRVSISTRNHVRLRPCRACEDDYVHLDMN